MACYLDADGEVRTRQLIQRLRQRGIEVYLPAVRASRKTLAFRHYTACTPLRPNRYGVLEPAPFQSPEISPRDLDLVLAPLVAFDGVGRRLGMGGGYYDATFAFLRRFPWHPPRLYGVAFAGQQVAGLPGEPWDMPLDGVITERGCVRPARSVSEEGVCLGG